MFVIEVTDAVGVVCWINSLFHKLLIITEIRTQETWQRIGYQFPSAPKKKKTFLFFSFYYMNIKGKKCAQPKAKARKYLALGWHWQELLPPL